MSKLEQVVEAVKGKLEGEYSVQSVEVLKNNGVEMIGVVIRSQGEQTGIVVYLPKERLERDAVSEIVNFVCQQYKEGRTAKNPLNGIEESIWDKQFVLSHVVYQLVNKEKNAKFLESVPQEKFLDLALIYRVMLRVGEGENASYVVSNAILQEIGVLPEELSQAAKENTQRLLGVYCRKLGEMLWEQFGMELPQEQGTESISIWVLTNSVKANGAVLMTYPSILSELAEKMGNNLLILPSSIHEVLIFAEPKDGRVEDFREMVREVNATEVSQQEFLSDSVYRFNKDTGTVEIAS